MSIDQIFKEAMQLPEADRKRLGNELLDSVQGEIDPEIDEAWAREAERRMAEYEAGKVSARPFDDVIADVRKRLESGR